MIRPTPVHRPVWRTLHDAVHRAVWASEGGSGIDWEYVHFGESDTRDRLVIATTGGDEIPDGTDFRAVIRFRPREDYTATTTYTENICSLIGGMAIRRVAATRRITFRGPSSVTGMVGTTATAIGDELIIVCEASAMRGTQACSLYVDGVLSETISNTAYVRGTPYAFSGMASLAIGGVNDGEPNAATAFLRGDLSEIRLWFGDAASAIELCQSHETKAEVTAKGSSTAYTLTATDRMVAGVTVLTSDGGGTATVATISGLDITTGSWTGAEPAVTEDVTWTTPAPAHISDILNNVIPPSNGAIAGIAPQVYFGGPGATVDDWNAGLNRGTLSAWTGGGVT